MTQSNQFFSMNMSEALFLAQYSMQFGFGWVHPITVENLNCCVAANK